MVYSVSGFPLDVVGENFEDVEVKEGNSIVFQRVEYLDTDKATFGHIVSNC